MARQEQDREDLLREATALVERVEFEVPGEPASVTIGFRRDGATSIYFGPDPVFQFNRSGELRRVYCDGKLLKADAGTLAELTRVRTVTETTLERRDLNEAETSAVLEAMRFRLAALHARLEQRDFRLVGQVPADADVVGRLRDALETLRTCRTVARTPRVG